MSPGARLATARKYSTLIVDDEEIARPGSTIDGDSMRGRFTPVATLAVAGKWFHHSDPVATSGSDGLSGMFGCYPGQLGSRFSEGVTPNHNASKPTMPTEDGT